MAIKDPMALAAVNLYGVLGALEKVCELDDDARAVCAGIKHPVALCFSIKGGPSATFHFSKNGCTITEGEAGCNAKMSFSTPEAFNNLIDCSKPGIPTKHPIRVLTFLTGPFTVLTNRLTAYLRPTKQDLADRTFFEKSTLLTMYTVAGAVSALANYDPIARISAGNTVDGDIGLGIKDAAAVTISVKDNHFRTERRPCAHPRAVMEFASVDLAYGLFNGQVSTVNELCKGNIRMAGMISMLDNVNRILDRVSVYLG